MYTQRRGGSGNNQEFLNTAVLQHAFGSWLLVEKRRCHLSDKQKASRRFLPFFRNAQASVLILAEPAGGQPLSRRRYLRQHLGSFYVTAVRDSKSLRSLILSNSLLCS